MATEESKSGPSQSLENNPEDSVLVASKIAEVHRRTIAAGSRHFSTNRTEPPNAFGSSIHEARSNSFPRIQAPASAPESSTTVPPLSSRQSSFTSLPPDHPEPPFAWYNLNPFDAENEEHSTPARESIENEEYSPSARESIENKEHLPPARKGVENEEHSTPGRKKSKKQHICSAIRDLWIEIKSRIKHEYKSMREARKAKETIRCAGIARIRTIDEGMADQIDIHRGKEVKRNSDARTSAKQDNICARANEKHRKDKQKKKEKRERKEEKEWKKEQR